MNETAETMNQAIKATTIQIGKYLKSEKALKPDKKEPIGRQTWGVKLGPQVFKFLN